MRLIRTMFITGFALCAYSLLPLPTHAVDVFGVGNCYCISTSNPYAVESCTDSTLAFNCTVKQQNTQLCITDTSTQTQCDEEENKAFTKTANGNCTCKIDGKPDAIYYNVTPDNCAAQKKGLVDDNEGKTVFCAYESSDKANCLCTLSDDDIFSPDDKDQTALATSDQAACEAKSTSNDDFEYQGQTWNAKCAWQGTFAEQQEQLAESQEEAPKQTTSRAPLLNVPIPGVRLQNVTVNEGVWKLPWIGQYIAGIYSFGVGVATVVSIIILMIGGLQIMTAAGQQGRVSKGKENIHRALMGLVLALGSYTLLHIINPDATALSSLTIATIDPEQLEVDLENAARVSDTITVESLSAAGGTSGAASGSGVSGGGGSTGKNASVGGKPSGGVLDNMQDNSWCTLKNKSEKKDEVPGAQMNFQYFGALDCNAGKKRDNVDIQYIVLHNGRGDNLPGKSYLNGLKKRFGESLYYPVWKQLRDWRSANFNDSCNCSSHFTIATDGTIYHTMDVTLAGKHAVGHNAKSIGVDLIYQKDDNKKIYFTEKQHEAVARLAQYLGSTYGFEVNDETVRGHGECQGNRSDPNNFDFEKMGNFIGKTFSNAKHARTQKGHGNEMSESCQKIP